MKRVLLLIGAVAFILVIVATFIYWVRRKEDPEVLLAWLRKGKGDKQENIMRLNMARGDVAAAMLRAFGDAKAGEAFRTQVLELIFKKQFREPDERVEKFILRVIKDPDPVIRRSAVGFFGVYTKMEEMPALIDCVNDPDSLVRKEALLVLSANNGDQSMFWYKTDQAIKDSAVRAAQKALASEKDPDLVYLERCLLGRQIKYDVRAALNAYQALDIEKGDSLFGAAGRLEKDNLFLRRLQARYYLKIDRRREALDLARACGDLLEIPPLSRAPVIDGDPEDEAWQRALHINDFFYIQTDFIPKMASQVKIEVRLGHYQGRLYYSFKSFEKDLDKLVAKCTQRDAQVYMDDCVEIILDPKNTDKDWYKFAINSAGVLMDTYNGNSKKNFTCEYRVKKFKDRGYWSIEFALNGKDLDNNVVARDGIWSMNFYTHRYGNGYEAVGVRCPFEEVNRSMFFPLAIFR